MPLQNGTCHNGIMVCGEGRRQRQAGRHVFLQKAKLLKMENVRQRELEFSPKPVPPVLVPVLLLSKDIYRVDAKDVLIK